MRWDERFNQFYCTQSDGCNSGTKRAPFRRMEQIRFNKKKKIPLFFKKRRAARNNKLIVFTSSLKVLKRGEKKKKKKKILLIRIIDNWVACSLAYTRLFKKWLFNTPQPPGLPFLPYLMISFRLASTVCLLGVVLIFQHFDIKHFV